MTAGKHSSSKTSKSVNFRIDSKPGKKALLSCMKLEIVESISIDHLAS